MDELVLLPQSNHYHIGLISCISVLEMIVTRVVLGKHHWAAIWITGQLFQANTEAQSPVKERGDLSLSTFEKPART